MMPEAKKTILLVDDEPDLLDSLSIRLRASGYEVLIAEDGPGSFKEGALDWTLI